MDLDTKRPYARVYGDGPIHLYEQDGKKFDSQGFWIHDNGVRVTPKEKVAAAQQALEEFDRKKKIEIDKQIRKFQEEEERLKKEAEELFYKECAKNLMKLEQPLSFFTSTEKVKDALDILGFSYDPNEKYSVLKEYLVKIFDAA